MLAIQVSGMYSEERTPFKHQYPVRAVALDPRYGQRKTREFVTGGDSGELVLHSRVRRSPCSCLHGCSIHAAPANCCPGVCGGTQWEARQEALVRP